jgi:hypothetical protein
VPDADRERGDAGAVIAWLAEPRAPPARVRQRAGDGRCVLTEIADDQYASGTGLGLALTRRLIESQGGGGSDRFVADGRTRARALATRVWAHSLGGQRTTDERTTSRPNTQPGLPSKMHLWKLPRSRPSPRRCAARCRTRGTTRLARLAQWLSPR